MYQRLDEVSWRLGWLGLTHESNYVPMLRRLAGAPIRGENYMRADIVAGLEQLSALRDASVTRTGRPEAAIDNIARFVCDFYVHHDYHTFLAPAA